MYKIDRIVIPSPSIRQIPRPVVTNAEPPVVRGIPVPVINVPTTTIDLPTIDVPTEEEFRQQMSQQNQTSDDGEENNRDLRTEQPTINIGGIEAPLPEAAPLITAGATAVVTTTVTLGATILVGRLKDAFFEPFMKRFSGPKKKKIKIKEVKPVLHYIINNEGNIDIFKYSQKGTQILDSTDDVERYIRDQVEIDSLYEIDNKIIIDDTIKEKFTKEGAKRFKPLFAPAKTIAKKLSAKFSF